MAKRTKNDIQQSHPVDGQTVPEADAAGNGSARSERDRIAQRAYELYQARGGTDGLAEEDWFSAEREIAGAGRQAEDS